MKVFSVIGLCAVFVVSNVLGPVAWAQDDTIPPVIEHTPVERVEGQQPVEIKANITDESGIFQPTVYYRRAGSASYSTVTMENKGDYYLANIPQFVVTGDLEYFIEAFDSFGNGPSRVGSPEAPLQVKFGPAAPPPAPVEEPPPAAEAPPADAATPAAEVPPAEEPPADDFFDPSGNQDPWYMQWYTFAAAGGVVLVTGVVLAIILGGKTVYDDQPKYEFYVNRP